MRAGKLFWKNEEVSATIVSRRRGALKSAGAAAQLLRHMADVLSGTLRREWLFQQIRASFIQSCQTARVRPFVLLMHGTIEP